MTRINLLPWREALRKERKRQFTSILGGAAFLMLAIVGYVHVYISGNINDQNSRNSFLQGEDQSNKSHNPVPGFQVL